MSMVEGTEDILSEIVILVRFVDRFREKLRRQDVFAANEYIGHLLGPLANPARVRRQLTGVFAPEWARPMAETLGRLGSETAWIVHGQGLDELTVAGENQVVAWEAGAVRCFTVTPEQAGLPRAPIEAIRGGDAALNAATLQALLQGATGPYRDTVLLNSAAALIVAGRTGDLREGVALASKAVASGAALGALETLRRETAER